jgi:hypothetical protein
MEGPLLVVDPKMPYMVEHHRDALFSFIPTNLLRHLMGPISLTPKFIPRMCPFLTRLDPLKSEICCHDHPIQPSLVNQRQELRYLLHPVSTRPL